MLWGCKNECGEGIVTAMLGRGWWEATVCSNPYKKNECGGRDLNPRTPTGTDFESVAFDHFATSAEE